MRKDKQLLEVLNAYNKRSSSHNELIKSVDKTIEEMDENSPIGIELNKVKMNIAKMEILEHGTIKAFNRIFEIMAQQDEEGEAI